MLQIIASHAQLHEDWTTILNSGVFTEGEYVKRLEVEIEKRTGLHAVAVNSAGSGLFAVLRCLYLPATGVVAVPNNTFFATAGMAVEVVGHSRVKPVDCCKRDFSMSYFDLDALSMEHKVSAVVLTHIGGWVAYNYAKIAWWCRDRGIPLIEDAAHMWGPKYEQAPGTLGAAAVYSFYPTKAVPAGEGGVVVTADAHLAEELRRFRNYGKHIVNGHVRYTGRGFNLRMDEWTAAVALRQVQNTETILELRAAAAERLSRVFPCLFTGEETNWYKYPVSANFSGYKTVGKIYALDDQVSASARLFDRAMPVSEWVAANHVCLPIYEHAYEGMSTDRMLAELGI